MNLISGRINKYKLVDCSILFLPILFILGSPFINFITILFTIIFLNHCYRVNQWEWLKEKWILIFLIFWIYNVINSFLSIDVTAALRSSFFYLRFLFFSLCIFYLGFKFLPFKKIIFFWIIIIAFVSFDIYFQYFIGFDLFGYKAEHGPRYSGPFGNELIAGSYLSRFLPLIIPLLIIISKKNKKNNILIPTFLILLIFSVLLTGERASFLFLLEFLILYFIFLFRNKISVLLKIFIPTLISLALLINLPGIKDRYSDLYNILINFEQSSYGKLYSSGIQVWKLNPINGVGFKNFRVNCDIQVVDLSDNTHPLCSTHPHNLYLEILSETGIIGFLLFCFFILFLLKKILKQLNFNKNEILKIVPVIILFLLIWPISTAGSFYTSWNGLYFWLYLGLFLNFSKNKISLEI